MTMKCLNWIKLITILFMLFIQSQAQACNKNTTYLPCYCCNSEIFLKYIVGRAAATESYICYVDIQSSAMSNSTKNIVADFVHDTEVIFNESTFGVIRTGTCLIVLSGEDNNMLFEKKLKKRQKVKLFNECITELDDGILESYVLKDGSIFKRDWVKRELVPLEEVFPIH